MPRLPIAKTVWGIDVSASAIKGVRMRLDGERVQILDADIIPLEGDPVGVESPGRDRRIWQALQRFDATHRLSNSRVAVGLPGSIFFVRPFNLFLVGTSTEADLVRFEMEQHMPFGLDAVLWDYEMFEPADQSVRERDGLLFAMKKEVLNGYLLSLSAARVEPSMVQAAPLAMLNFVRHEINPEGPTVVVDIGAASTTVLALSGARYWLRTLPTGGEALTAALGGAFKPREVSHDEAEAIKVHLPQLGRRGEMVDRLTPALRSFVGDLRTALQHLANEHKQSIDRMILLGGGSAMYGLQTLLADELKMRVIVPAGLGRIEIAEEADAQAINNRLPELATAIGLGLQALGRAATRVNMVDATLVQRRSQTMARRTLAIGLAAALALTVAFGLFATWRKSTYANATAQLRQRIAPMEMRFTKSRKLAAPGEAEALLTRLENYTTDRAVFLTVLDKIARMLPENRKPTVAYQDKLWIMRVTLRAKPGTAGVYDGEIEAGTPLRRDGSHFQYIERMLRTPLAGDERGIFRNVGNIDATMRSPVLSFSGASAGGQPKYFLVQLRFEVAPDGRAAR